MGRKSFLRQFIKAPAAAVALLFVGIVMMMAIFAYFLGNDATPNANRMSLELSARPPGFRQTFLLIPKNYAQPKNGFWQRLIHGVPDSYTWLPVQEVIVQSEEVIAIHQVDETIVDTLVYKRTLFPLEEGQQFQKRYLKDVRFWLGTDRYGRDVWSRLLLGARVSMAVGLVSTLIAVTIGLLMGAWAGWFGGWIDKLIMYLVNVLWAIPTVLLVFAITLTMGKGFWELFFAIGLSSWVSIARLVRGQVLQVREMDYITAARTFGYSNLRIIFKHVLPNISGPVIVMAATTFATAILVEAGLSFLGIGVQPPVPSWGLMIKEHYNFLLAGRPLSALVPGIAIMLLVLALNIIGNRLRDMLDAGRF